MLYILNLLNASRECKTSLDRRQSNSKYDPRVWSHTKSKIRNYIINNIPCQVFLLHYRLEKLYQYPDISVPMLNTSCTSHTFLCTIHVPRPVMKCIHNNIITYDPHFYSWYIQSIIKQLDSHATVHYKVKVDPTDYGNVTCVYIVITVKYTVHTLFLIMN